MTSAAIGCNSCAGEVTASRKGTRLHLNNSTVADGSADYGRKYVVSSPSEPVNIPASVTSPLPQALPGELRLSFSSDRGCWVLETQCSSTF